MKRIGRHLSYANVVATLALVLALGLGGAWAAGKIGSKDIKRGAVKSKAIKNATIVGKDVRDGSIAGADVADGSIDSADLAPIEVSRPQLGNGGQNDCLWIDTAAGEPGIAPVSYRRNGYGEVSLSGIVQPTDGPGGDADCSGSGSDAISDSMILALDSGDAPAKSGVYFQPGGATAVVVVGAGGVAFGSTQYQPGAVLGAVSAQAQLDGISFLAADASGASPTSAPDRISPRKLRELLHPQG